MGAIIGALYAAGMTAADLTSLVLGTSLRDLIDISMKAGLLKGQRLAEFMADYLPADFSDLQIPLAVTTTDIETGEQVVLTDGDLITAIRASSSLPGAFEPVPYRGRVLADGGIINNLPVDAAAYLGANRTIASDVTPVRHVNYVPPSEEGNFWERLLATVRLERRNPMLQMMLRSTDIMQAILTDLHHSLHPAGVHIRMPLPGIRLESFWDAEQIIEMGAVQAREALTAAGMYPQEPAGR